MKKMEINQSNYLRLPEAFAAMCTSFAMSFRLSSEYPVHYLQLFSDLTAYAPNAEILASGQNSEKFAAIFTPGLNAEKFAVILASRLSALKFDSLASGLSAERFDVLRSSGLGGEKFDVIIISGLNTVKFDSILASRMRA